MQSLKVTGMTCGGCARAVERAVGGVAADVKVDLAAAEVRFADTADAARVAEAIRKAGFGIAPAA